MKKLLCWFTDSTLTILRYFLSSLLITLCCSTVAAQSAKIDSLRSLEQKSRGIEKVDALNTLAFEMFSFDFSKSKEYAQEALQLSTDLKYDKGIAEALIYNGVAEFSFGNDSISIPLFKRSIALSNRANLNHLEGFGLTYLGLNYQNLNRLDSAQLYYDKAYLILKDSLQPYYLSLLYLNLGSLSGLKNDTENEINYLQKCWDIRRNLKDKRYSVYIGQRIAAFYNDQGNYSEALSFLDKIQKLIGKDTIDNEEISIIYKQRALVYVNQGKSVEALKLFYKTKSFYERNHSTLDLTNSYLDIGLALTHIGNYEISLKNYFSGLALAEVNHYEYEQTQLLYGIGWVYRQINQISLAQDFATKALKAAQEHGYKMEEAYALNLLGLLANHQNKDDEAYNYLTQALAIRKEKGDRAATASTLENLGDLFEKKKEYERSEAYALQSMALEEEINNREGMADSYQSLGQLYIKMGKLDKALRYLIQAETIAHSIKAPDILIKIYKNRRDLSVALGNYKEANNYSLLYEHVRDSIFTDNLSNRIFSLQYDLQLDQQAQEIKILNQQHDLQAAENRFQRTVIIVTIVILVIVLALGYLLYSNYKKIKQFNKAISEQKEEIQAQAEELTESNQIISQQNEKLKLTYDEVSAQNEELIQSQEEIASQRDIVSEQNTKLEEARMIIEKQHEEIKLRNENLEAEVEHRTKELIEYNQQLEQFAFISSHNLRAPVARILGLGQLMELSGRSAEDDALIHKSLILTTRELDRVVRDLNTILEIRKNNTSVLTEIELDEEVKLIRVNLEKEIAETRTEIHTDFSTVNKIQSIRPYIDSILINLISNAIKYRHPHRTPIIQIKTQRKDDFILLTVKDNGLGIDLTLYKEKIFTLYSRFHNHVEGKGLGLYLVKTQVVAMGGRIEVESEADEGITFSIYLKA